MKVREIVVTAGRTFNHPYESYSNLRPEVEIRATVEEYEDTAAAVKELQAQAEQLVEDHKHIMLQQLHNLETMTRRQKEVAMLESSIKTAQASLDKLRDDSKKLSSEPLSENQN